MICDTLARATCPSLASSAWSLTTPSQINRSKRIARASQTPSKARQRDGDLFLADDLAFQADQLVLDFRESAFGLADRAR